MLTLKGSRRLTILPLGFSNLLNGFLSYKSRISRATRMIPSRINTNHVLRFRKNISITGATDSCSVCWCSVYQFQWAIPQICSEGSMFIPLYVHIDFSSLTLARILCDGRHTLQVWHKRVAVLGPIRSNHLQTHRPFLVDPHQNTKMGVNFEINGVFP